MDEEQRAAVRSQIGKNVVKVYAVCWDLLYSLSQINMPRYAHQEIALAERRIRDKTQKALHALTFLFSACCSLPFDVSASTKRLSLAKVLTLSTVV